MREDRDTGRTTAELGDTPWRHRLLLDGAGSSRTVPSGEIFTEEISGNALRRITPDHAALRQPD